ncbi:MAG: DUF3795 domain-containing protein [Anaerolineales bacterium]
MTNDERIIAVCGMDCTACPIRTADIKKESAESLIGWWKGEGWVKEGEGVEDLMKRGPYCRGCRGDRKVHWSADCWILACAVDQKGLAHCSECAEFPCAKLTEWSKAEEMNAKAFDRLVQIKSAASSAKPS